MTQSTRKLLGTLLTLIMLVVYAGVASWIYLALLTGWPAWALLVYFAIAGLLWAVPAGVIITWMSRPD